MADLDVRPARHEDLPALTEIYAQAVATGRSTGDLSVPDAAAQERWFAGHRPDRAPVYVAEAEGAVLGYNALSLYRGGRAAFGRTRETSFYVHNSVQRRGVASALLDHVLGECPGLGVDSLITFVLARNRPSIAFLEAYGFELWGRLPALAVMPGGTCDHLIFGRRV